MLGNIAVSIRSNCLWQEPGKALSHCYLIHAHHSLVKYVLFLSFTSEETAR